MLKCVFSVILDHVLDYSSWFSIVTGECLPCPAGYYCNGDGLRHKCGCARNDSGCNNIPSEYSNGLASECSVCPEGWICSDGRAHPCQSGYYADLCGIEV